MSESIQEADSGMSGLKNAKLAYEAAVEARDKSRKTTEENMKITDIQISDLEKKIEDINGLCRAAIDGVAAYVGVQEGAFTSSMQPAYRIINPDKLRIRAKVNEYDIKSVSAGQKVRVTGDAIDKRTEISGVVESVSPVPLRP